jgi:hypothetical protein
MKSENKLTTISVSKQTHDEIQSIGYKGENFDEAINKLITFTKKFGSEQEFSNWFKENYYLFGFDSIIKENPRIFPDFIVKNGDKELRVELETHSSNFIMHKHNPNEVDLVICLVKNKELPVKTIEIKRFEYVMEGWILIKIRKKTAKLIKADALTKSESYDEILNRWKIKSSREKGAE